MTWDLIPEAFFDFIARLVPGSLFLVGALAVYFGPQASAEVLVSTLPAANLAALLLFGLLAYFASIVLKEIWEIGTQIVGAARDGAPSVPILSIRSQMPAECSWLLKLQAEKSICEVLVPGVVILFLANLWLIATGSSAQTTERIALAFVLLISVVACWRWRKSLERFYCEGMIIVERLSKGRKPK
jgi:hypothetical protein